MKKRTSKKLSLGKKTVRRIDLDDDSIIGGGDRVTGNCYTHSCTCICHLAA